MMAYSELIANFKISKAQFEYFKSEKIKLEITLAEFKNSGSETCNDCLIELSYVNARLAKAESSYTKLAVKLAEFKLSEF